MSGEPKQETKIERRFGAVRACDESRAFTGRANPKHRPSRGDRLALMMGQTAMMPTIADWRWPKVIFMAAAW